MTPQLMTVALAPAQSGANNVVANGNAAAVGPGFLQAAAARGYRHLKVCWVGEWAKNLPLVLSLVHKLCAITFVDCVFWPVLPACAAASRSERSRLTPCCFLLPRTDPAGNEKTPYDYGCRSTTDPIWWMQVSLLPV